MYMFQMDDEIQILSAMFCSKDEKCEVMNLNPPIRTVKVDLCTRLGSKIRLKFDVDTESYPRQIESSLNIDSSLGCAVKNQRLNDFLKLEATKLENEPALVHLCQEALEFYNKVMEDEVPSEPREVTASYFLSLTQFDHMRDTKGYIRTLERWILRESELKFGRLLFGRKIMLILIANFEDDLKSFQQKLKTHNVDVDSNGKPCKEKMSKVLCNCLQLKEATSDLKWWTDTLAKPTTFSVIEFKNNEEIDSILTQLKLEKLSSFL